MRYPASLLAGAALAATLAGCAQHSTTGTADAAALVTQSAAAMRAVTGAHFTLNADGKVPNLKVTKVEGDVSSTPAPVGTATATVAAGLDAVDTKLIYTDGRLYSDIADPGHWTDYGDGSSIYNISILLNPQKGLANALATLKNPTAAVHEDIDGVPATRITATSSTTDIALLAGATKAPEKAREVPVTVWIADTDPHHLLKAQVDITPDAHVSMTLSDFGKTVTATKPV